MSLIGYVTLEEATEYVVTHYLSSDDLRKAWEGLSDENRTVLLNKSFQAIELLPFSGRKSDPDQPNAFPRWPHRSVPAAIKSAQIELAVARSDSSNEDDAKYYERLWTYGVESYSIGNLSEKTNGTGAAQHDGIVSAIASRLLRPFMGGGYRM